MDMLAFSTDGALLGDVEGLPAGDPDVPDPTLCLRSSIHCPSPEPVTRWHSATDDPCALEPFGEHDFAYSACVDPRGRTDLLDITNRTVTASFPSRWQCRCIARRQSVGGRAVRQERQRDVH